MNNLILHIHPAQVPTRALRFTYTWGLGGLSALLVVLLVITGALLQFHYTPSPDAAYNSILALQTDVWFGALVRNVHHWAGNLMLVVVFLHLLRIFFTAAFRPPREFNWLLGIGLLLLTVAANFTGYLLPWDQLAYWGITVGTSILRYVPLIGGWLSQLLLGGPEVGPATLLNFYALHIAVIPMVILFIMSYHFWRVRKDGFSLPRAVGEAPVARPEKSYTISDLVRPEAVMATVAIAAITIWSMRVAAPLEPLADPALSPNPAKAPWYFMGLQELLLHFHPLVGAIVIPALALLTLAALPYLDTDMDAVGIYFRSRRGRWLSLFGFVWGILLTFSYVIVDEFFLDWAALLPGLPTVISNGLVPLALLLLGLIGFYELVQRGARATRCEAILATFTLILGGFVTLTAVGIFLRGAGMALVLPG
jgi:quinol-cytochrome oxidoreductase complex cytochrome b subunit